MIIHINSPKSTFAAHRNGVRINGPKSAIAKLRKALMRKDTDLVVSFTLCPSGVPTSIAFYHSMADYLILVDGANKTELIVYPDRKGCIVIQMEV